MLQKVKGKNVQVLHKHVIAKRSSDEDSVRTAIQTHLENCGQSLFNSTYLASICDFTIDELDSLLLAGQFNQSLPNHLMNKAIAEMIIDPCLAMQTLMITPECSTKTLTMYYVLGQAFKSQSSNPISQVN